MKNYITYFFAVVVVALGSSCEVYDIINTTDTIYVDRPIHELAPTIITVHDTTVVRDTISITIVLRDTIIQQVHTVDTVYKVVTKDVVVIKEVKLIEYDTIVQTLYDTIINNIHHYDTIMETVTLYDTTLVYDRTVVYIDSFFVISAIRPVNYIPDELLPYVQEFYQLAGPSANGGPMILQYVHPEDLAGENWSSDSFWFGGQWSQMVIELDESLPSEQHRAGILRELARLQLKKKYVTDVNKIMCPLFDPSRTITQSDLQVLFNPLPI